MRGAEAERGHKGTKREELDVCFRGCTFFSSPFYFNRSLTHLIWTKSKELFKKKKKSTVWGTTGVIFLKLYSANHHPPLKKKASLCTYMIATEITFVN